MAIGKSMMLISSITDKTSKYPMVEIPSLDTALIDRKNLTNPFTMEVFKSYMPIMPNINRQSESIVLFFLSSLTDLCLITAGQSPSCINSIRYSPDTD